jgi:hypothetical protein
MGDPATPFGRIPEVEVVRRATIQLRNQLGKPVDEEDQ